MRSTTFLYAVITGLAVVVALDFYQINQLKKSRVIYVRALGGVLSLPNDFALDTTRVDETTLLGQSGRVIVGRTQKTDFANYLKERGARASQRCGLSMIEGILDGVRTVLIQGKDAYMVMTGLSDRAEKDAIESLCKSRLGQ